MDTSVSNANRTYTDINNKSITGTTGSSSSRLGDKIFMEQKNLILQDINNTMDSILNGLNELNISLESSIAVGKDFESVSNLWKTFYNEHESVLDGNEEDDEEEEEEEEEDMDRTGSLSRSDM